jgi:nucleoside-diphosphate-sugar epimerase
MSRIFLTGGGGNVGRYTLKELLRRGYEVTALVHSNTALEGCRTVQARLSEAGKYAAEVAVADGVIHLASTRSVERAPVVREDIYGTGLLLDSWRKGNFVYMSSQSVYGVPRGPLTEDHALSPVCWYDIAKICCEQQMAIESPRPGRGVGIPLRMALLFGPGGHGRGDQFLESLYPNCASGNPFIFKSEEALETAGSSFVGPEDLARALVDSLDLKVAGPFNISSGFCTWRELLEGICRKAGFPAPKFVVSALPGQIPPGLPMPQSRSFVDPGKFYGAAGFSPKQDLDILLDEFVRSMSKQ